MPTTIVFLLVLLLLCAVASVCGYFFGVARSQRRTAQHIQGIAERAIEHYKAGEEAGAKLAWKASQARQPTLTDTPVVGMIGGHKGKLRDTSADAEQTPGWKPKKDMPRA